MGGCICRVCPVLVWHHIDIFMFGYCNYMVITSVVLYFLDNLGNTYFRNWNFAIFWNVFCMYGCEIGFDSTPDLCWGSCTERAKSPRFASVVS
jgi:hypothetical protein